MHHLPTLAGRLASHSEDIGRSLADELAGIMKAVAQYTRLRIMSMLMTADKGGMNVVQITAPLGLSQPTVSHHLRILSEAGLVKREKRGVWAYYTVSGAAFTQLADAVQALQPKHTVRKR